MSAQVWTHILGQHESLADYVSWHPDTQPEAILLPAVDVAAAINEDQRTGNPNNRFGLEIPLTLTEQDGSFTEMPDGYTIWTMKIRSAASQPCDRAVSRPKTQCGN